MKRAACILGLALLAACAATPPAHWARGGAAVDLPRARWVRGDATIEIAPDGKVTVDGEHELTIDRAGRVFDQDAQPVALLEPDGRVVGPDDVPLGFAGSDTAALPGESSAWIGLLRTGEVIRYGADGSRSSLGVWIGGCTATPHARHVCVLVSHLLAMRMRDRSSPGTGIGIGIGVGVGVGIPAR